MSWRFLLGHRMDAGAVGCTDPTAMGGKCLSVCPHQQWPCVPWAGSPGWPRSIPAPKGAEQISSKHVERNLGSQSRSDVLVLLYSEALAEHL